ncbi:cytochrome c maturation protein CcmE [Chloroflexota bacterium]
MRNKQSKTQLKRIKWLIVAVIIGVLLFGHSLFLFLFSWGGDSLTVSEFNAQVASSGGQQVRVEGTVAVGSIQWDDDTLVLKFSLTDGKEKINVSYHGIVPDTFRPGNNMILEGKYSGDGVLEAINLNSSRPVCTVCH